MDLIVCRISPNHLGLAFAYQYPVRREVLCPLRADQTGECADFRYDLMTKYTTLTFLIWSISTKNSETVTKLTRGVLQLYAPDFLESFRTAR